jgi:hypothetical protein
VLRKLEDRFTGRSVVYKNTAQGSILWDVLEQDQLKFGRALGIRQGTTESSIIRDRTYEYSNIKNVFTNMGDVINGCDFSFVPETTAQGIFTGYRLDSALPNAVLRTNLPPIITGVSSNVISYKAKSAADIVNAVIVKGAGTGEEYITAEAEDTASQNTFGVVEKVVSKTDVQEKQTLQQWADGIVEEERYSTYIIEFEMKSGGNLNPDSFNEGDLLNINLDIFNGLCTVLSKEFVINPEGILEWGMKVKFVFA